MDQFFPFVANELQFVVCLSPSLYKTPSNSFLTPTLMPNITMIITITNLTFIAAAGAKIIQIIHCARSITQLDHQGSKYGYW
jgi:hypothetical protein